MTIDEEIDKLKIAEIAFLGLLSLSPASAYAANENLVYCQKDLLMTENNDVYYDRYFLLENGHLTPRNHPKDKNHAVLSAPFKVELQPGTSNFPRPKFTGKETNWRNSNSIVFVMDQPTDAAPSGNADIYFITDSNVENANIVLATASGQIGTTSATLEKATEPKAFRARSTWATLPKDIAKGPFVIDVYVNKKLAERLNFDISKTSFLSLYKDEAKRLTSAKGLTVDDSTKIIKGLPECKY